MVQTLHISILFTGAHNVVNNIEKKFMNNLHTKFQNNLSLMENSKP